MERKRLNIVAKTDTGKIRERNEDSYLIINQERVVFGVCDGMGGHAHGEVASNLAVEVIKTEMLSGVWPDSQEQVVQRLDTSLVIADLRICEEADKDRCKYGMGTTATITARFNDLLFFGQVGDSRGYCLRETRLVQMTRDQTPIQDAIDNGSITEVEARNAPNRGMIHKALGRCGGSVMPVITILDLRKGDIILICSDGLTEMLTQEQIRKVLIENRQNLSKACKILINLANMAGGHDNITVVIAEFDDEDLEPPSSEDIANLQRREFDLVPR